MFFLNSPTKAQREAEKRHMERRLKEAVPWTDGIKWSPCMTIQADTFEPPSLFKVCPMKPRRCNFDELDKSQCVLSPDGNWAYTEIILPRGTKLDCAFGAQYGDIAFDGKIAIPRLNMKYSNGTWSQDPYMSITPQEILTLRAGTRFAKGKVILGGLGMGHQLEQVCKRKKVKKVVVVETEQALIDWIAPELDLNGKDVEFVCGDAKKLIPNMEADAALIDIYKMYGFNTFPHCPKINKVWVWGSAKLPDRGYW